MKQDLSFLPALLLPWYAKHGRALPWRAERTPYRVWLSEVMLQQTRTAAVTAYYQRFLEAAPDIAELAALPEDRLLKLWEGLGYYSRARNLQKAARQIMAEHGGVFPPDYAAIRALPGVGDYTAGAIASLCFQEKTPAIDGNVLRILARLLADARSDSPALRHEYRAALQAVYPEAAGNFTEALMELGETICLPAGAPHCAACPLATHCYAHAAGRESEFPQRRTKKARRIEQRTVFLLYCGDTLAVQQRPKHGLLAAMWELPNVLGALSPEAALAQAAAWGCRVRELRAELTRQHIFTHVEWQMTGYVFDCASLPADCLAATPQQLATEIALPTAFRIFFS